MNSIKFLLFPVLIGMLVSTSSCKKEVVGPKGDPGEPGPGNTIVYNSDEITVSSSSWVEVIDAVTSRVSWKTTIYSDQITANVAGKGTVRVMIKVEQAWWELPYIFEADNFTTFGFQEGLIRLENYDGHGSAPRPATSVYRFVTTTPM